MITKQKIKELLKRYNNGLFGNIRTVALINYLSALVSALVIFHKLDITMFFAISIVGTIGFVTTLLFHDIFNKVIDHFL